MMGSKFTNGIDSSLLITVVVLVIMALSVGLFAMWGIPKLWQWLKLLFDQITF